jgi:sugar phosphate permease
VSGAGSGYRWAVLGSGTFAQTTYSAIWFGIAVMAPVLRREYALSLGQTGVLISASLVGSVVSLIPWGLATDRYGERAVLVAGLAVCGAALLAASRTHGFWPLAVLLSVAGAFGASVQSASGRAVMHWFAPSQRGLALGLRQTAIPLSGFLISVALPPVVHAGGIAWGFAAMGIASLAGAAVGGLVLREAPLAEAAQPGGRGPLRDRRLWTLSVGSALVLAPQLCVAGFAVVFLHDRRGLSTSHAAAVLAVMQALAVAGRIGAGRWSDVLASRLVPLRRIALGAAVLVALTGVLLSAPLAVLVPVLVVAGVVSMSWNSLSFAAAVEIAGHGRSGAAIGLQQTLLNLPGSVYPALFGVFVAATSWRLAFFAVALFPLAGWRVLRDVSALGTGTAR